MDGSFSSGVLEFVIGEVSQGNQLNQSIYLKVFIGMICFAEDEICVDLTYETFIVINSQLSKEGFSDLKM